MPTPKADEVVECPSCGGHSVQIIKFQGERYYQCVSLVERNGRIGVPCKFWSTKWAPEV
jgi:hypothetical protein